MVMESLIINELKRIMWVKKTDLLGVLCVWTNHQLASTGVGVGVGEVVQPEVDHVVAVVLARDHQVP